MENLQILLVIISGILALLYLFRKYIIKQKNNSNNNCGSDCGCS